MTLMYKTLTDLRDVIKEFEGFLARPTPRLHHPTLYRKGSAGQGEVIIKGIRKKDFLFSADWQHLKSAFKMKEGRNLGKQINVYFTLEKSDIPAGLAFVVDYTNKRHYLLTVTEMMTVSRLVSKLKLLAHRMSVIKHAGKVL